MSGDALVEMGRLIGKRPDDTRLIAKRIAEHLEPGEHVLAGVQLQRPGTFTAELEAGVSGAVNANFDLPPNFRDADPAMEEAWREQTATARVDAETAKRAIWVYLVLTSSRLLLVRRSRLLRWRPREVIAAWPLEEIERIEVPRNGDRVTVHHGVAGSLDFELPQAHKFLPQVYRDLPSILEKNRA